MKWLTIIGGTLLLLAFVGVGTGLAVLVVMFIFM